MLDNRVPCRVNKFENHTVFYLPRTLRLANVEIEHAVSFIPEVISYLLRSKSWQTLKAFALDQSSNHQHYYPFEEYYLFSI